MFKNFSFLTLGRTSGDFFNFLLFVLIARTFGQESIGQYSFAMALVGFFLVFADFGLYYLTIKELSQKVLPFETSFSHIFWLRITLSVGVMGMLSLITPFLFVQDQTKFLIIIIGGSFIFGTLVDGIAAVFIAHGGMKRAGVLDSSHRVSGAVAASIVVLLGGDLLLAVSMLPIMTVIHCAVAYYLVHQSFGPPRLSISLASMSAKVRQVIPYFFSELLGQILIRTNILVLGFVLGTTAAGVYNVAFRVVLGLMFLPIFAGITLLPTASNLFLQDKEKLIALYNNSLKVMVFLGLPASCGMWLIAPDLIELVYGERYSESYPVLRILSGLVFLFSLRNILGTFLTAVNLQFERTKMEWYGAIAIVLGNLVCIPIWGVEGSAVVTIMSEVLLLIMFVRPLIPLLGSPKIGPALMMSGTACSAFVIPVFMLSTWSLLGKILVSVFLYMATLFLFKEVRTNEFPKFRDMFKNSANESFPATEGICREHP